MYINYFYFLFLFTTLQTTFAQCVRLFLIFETETFLTPSIVAQMLRSLPQCQAINSKLATDILELCVKYCHFDQGHQAQEYFRTRARW